jgi:hypothetical protein
LLISIGGHGFASVYTAAEHCFGSASAAPTSGCDTSKSCCCGDAPRHACGCSTQDEPAETQFPASPDDNQRVLKWATGPAALAVEILPPPCYKALTSADRLDFAPVERSIQSRHCIWRC